MEAIAAAPPAPSTQELIEQLGAQIDTIIKASMSDEADADRVWILRKIHKSYLYFRDLENFSPQLFQSIVDATGISGPLTSTSDGMDSGLYDYTQNQYRGYCRKFEALLGNRLPNVIAVPNDANDPESVNAADTANNAAYYIRHHCDLQIQNLYLAFGLFCFGTMFWHIDFVRDGDKYGYTPQKQMSIGDGLLGDEYFECPECANTTPVNGGGPPTPPANCPTCNAPMSMNNYHPPTQGQVPQESITQQENGSLEISLHDATEVTVPLSGTCCDTVPWLKFERTKFKGELLRKYEQKDGSNPLREPAGGDGYEDASSAGVYAESIRSAMASPIGLVRPKRADEWIETDIWWTPAMFEMVDDKDKRQLLKDNFKKGLRIVKVRGKTIDLKDEKLSDHWQECKPEPSNRIMGDALGDDWIQTQDILNNTLNQANEIIERSTQAGFGDPTRVDFDALQQRRNYPGELIPVLRPAGGQLSDVVYFPPPIEFSEQLPAFRQGVEQNAQYISGLPETVWGGGDAEEPTARQAELKKNAALQQLGVPWTFIGKSYTAVNAKSCKILAEYEDGVLSFSKKTQFGNYESLSVEVANLRSNAFHFEFDEAIPMTWGQERDLIMWLIGTKDEKLQQKLGFNDPLNIVEIHSTLGMHEMRVPGLDQRNKGMRVIFELLDGEPQPGQVDPSTNQPGPQQASMEPDYEDDKAFMAELCKAYLINNPDLKKNKPNGYKNVQLYAQACEQAANAPPPPPSPKASLAVSLKGSDIGTPAVQAGLIKTGLVPDGTHIQQQPPLAAVETQPPLLPVQANGLPAPNGALAPPAPPPVQ